MTTHDLTGTAIRYEEDADNTPPCALWTDPVYKGKPFEQGTLFLLAEIRALLKNLQNK